LVEELEMKFHGRFKLEIVDIKKKENLKYLRLYRLDIPVCFLNGQVRRGEDLSGFSELLRI
jgi:hypothetical protein